MILSDPLAPDCAQRRLACCHPTSTPSDALTLPIIVRETWYLKDEYHGDALSVFQEMDSLLGPGAHEQEGWTDHARFYHNDDLPERVEVFYPWGSKELHDRLREREADILREFEAKYFSRPRTFEFFTELPVEVD